MMVNPDGDVGRDGGGCEVVLRVNTVTRRREATLPRRISFMRNVATPLSSELAQSVNRKDDPTRQGAQDGFRSEGHRSKDNGKA